MRPNIKHVIVLRPWEKLREQKQNFTWTRKIYNFHFPRKVCLKYLCVNQDGMECCCNLGFCGKNHIVSIDILFSLLFLIGLHVRQEKSLLFHHEQSKIMKYGFRTSQPGT